MAGSIVWFRDDLRLADNPALTAAVRIGAPLVCLFVLDDASPGHRRPGAAARWWLHQSLDALADGLEQRGSSLVLRRGPAALVVPQLAREIGAGAVFWNRRYGAAERATDTAIKADLQRSGVEAVSFNGNLLHEPWGIATRDGGAFKVFTPFWRAVLARGEPRRPASAADALARLPAVASDRLYDWALKPVRPDWSGTIAGSWTPGEAGALGALSQFLDDGGPDYADHRDQPDKRATSRLSPHLRFGEISPAQVWHAIRHAEAVGTISGRAAEKFLSELGWREFCYHLLYAAEDLRAVNVQRRFDAFPWRHDEVGLRAWTSGKTGYPLVDAGMRELLRTGWMHNRVRMVAASFLVKHLLIDWRTGEDWFWDTLVDADPASNPASWQWVAGSGADAAPYFRIFNPIAQGERFDPEGAYVRRFVPELARLPDAWIHRPWQAPADVLAEAGVVLGSSYPAPVVDHAAARLRALAALASLDAMA